MNVSHPSPRSPNISKLYAQFQRCSGVATKLKDVQPGSMFFALDFRKPVNRWRRIVWRLWTALEFNAPGLLQGLANLAKRLSLGEEIQRLIKNEYDGNAYARRALELGASCAVVSKPRAASDDRFILVEDVAATLRALADLHRSNFKNPVIAITGSAGKSTTVRLTHTLLATQYNAYFNAHLNGGDRFYATVLGIPLDADLAVIEIASISVGMIKKLCAVLRPTHGLITNVGRAHLNTFGSLENIRKAKWELNEYLEESGGTVYLNTNHPWLAEQRFRLEKPWLFGSGPDARTRGTAILAEPYLEIRLYAAGNDSKQSKDVQTRMAGRFNLDNALAAAAVARSFGVPDSKIHACLERFLPPENRSEVFTWGTNRVFNDNSHSTAVGLLAALDSFQEFSGEKRLLIIGDIPGLGNEAAKIYQEVFSRVDSLRPAQAVFVGPKIYSQRHTANGLFFRTPKAFFEWFSTQQIDDTLIFVKGFTRLRLLDAIRPLASTPTVMRSPQ